MTRRQPRGRALTPLGTAAEGSFVRIRPCLQSTRHPHRLRATSILCRPYSYTARSAHAAKLRRHLIIPPLSGEPAICNAPQHLRAPPIPLSQARGREPPRTCRKPKGAVRLRRTSTRLSGSWGLQGGAAPHCPYLGPGHKRTGVRRAARPGRAEWNVTRTTLPVQPPRAACDQQGPRGPPPHASLPCRAGALWRHRSRVHLQTHAIV